MTAANTELQQSALIRRLPLLATVICALQPLMDVLSFWQAELGMSNVLTLAVRFGGGYDPNFSFVAKCPLPLPLHELLPVHLGILCFSPPYIAILCAVQFALCLVTYFLYRLIARLAGGAKGGNGGTPGEIQKISRSTGV